MSRTPRLSVRPFGLRISFILTAALAASSCNIIFSVSPELWIVESGLEEREARPKVAWNVVGLNFVQGFRIAVHTQEATGAWSDLDREQREYRVDSFLFTGTYTVQLQSRSTAGIWSNASSVEVVVFAVEPFTPTDPLFGEPANYDPFDGDPVQWNLDEIQIPRMWGLIRELEGLGLIEREEVVVAVVDTGYTEHPDVVDLMDTTIGYDFISLDTNLEPPVPPWYWAQDGDGIDPVARDEGDNPGRQLVAWNRRGERHKRDHEQLSGHIGNRAA